MHTQLSAKKTDLKRTYCPFVSTDTETCDLAALANYRLEWSEIERCPQQRKEWHVGGRHRKVMHLLKKSDAVCANAKSDRTRSRRAHAFVK